MNCFKVVLVSLLTLIVVAYAGADTITLVADRWCPLNCIPKSDEPGYVVELARKIFERSGHSIDYILFPWKRAILMTREGQFNGIIGAMREEAEDFIFPSEDVGLRASDFFVRKGNPWRFENIDSLKKVRLGAILDYSYSMELDAYIRDNPNKVDVISGDDAIQKSLKKLAAGRIDVFLDQRDVITFTAGKLGLSDQIEFAGSNNLFDPIYIAFSPANPKSAEYAAILARGIRDFRDSGELAKIMARYGLIDWKVNQARNNASKPPIQ